MDRVLELLRESGAMLDGHFLLSSGRHSGRYFQCARLFRYPLWAEEALVPVAARIRADIDAGLLALDAVAGPAMGGIIAAYELGRQLGLPALFTERDDSGIMSLRRFEARGLRCLIAEDVITTGKSSLECAAALEKSGALAVAAACLVDRRAAEEGGAPWPVYAGCRVEAESREPSSCELCGQGIPLVKPGSRKPV